MTKLYFCNLPYLSTDYTNVLTWGSSDLRKQFFEEQTKLEYEGNVKHDGEREYININLTVEELRNYDYLYFRTRKGIPYYYFITNIEYKTPNNSNIYIQLDVWTTYYFNYSILPSFVDRCHVDRWDGDVPTPNYEDEGLYYGDIVQQEKETICNLGKSIIVTTSVPIGCLASAYYSSDDSSTSVDVSAVDGDGDWQNQVVSANLLRYVKGWEGYSPYAYKCSAGYWTIGYGITKIGEPDYYATLVAETPASEQRCAEVLLDRLCNSYGAYVLPYAEELGVTKQQEFDAMVSFAYNLGCAYFGSDNSLRNAIKSKDYDTLVDCWGAYSYAGGSWSQPHYKRRIEEIEMFCNGTYKMRTISKYGSDGSIVGSVSGDGWLPSTSTAE